jgi:hypothetical protein
MLDFLTPARRKAFYSLVAAVTALLVVAGIITPEIAASYGGLVVAGFEVVALVLSSIKARRADMTAIYAAGAALVVALRVAGILNDGDASHWTDVWSHVVALVPLVLAVIRTDTTTPTGEPAPELEARAAGPRL